MIQVSYPLRYTVVMLQFHPHCLLNHCFSFDRDNTRMISEVLFVTVVYWMFGLIVLFPPSEAAAAGLTIDTLLDQWLGSESITFIQYHMRRTAVTCIVHTLLVPGGWLGGIAWREDVRLMPSYLCRLYVQLHEVLFIIIVIVISVCLFFCIFVFLLIVIYFLFFSIHPPPPSFLLLNTFKLSIHLFPKFTVLPSE